MIYGLPERLRVMAFPNPPEKERRKEPRRKPKSNLSVWCRKGTTGLGSNLAKAVLDISTSGLRLRLTERLEPHQEIEVELLTAEMKYRYTVTADVVWCLA